MRYDLFANASYMYVRCSRVSLAFGIVLSVLAPCSLKSVVLYREKRNAPCTGTLSGAVQAHCQSGGVDGVSRVPDRPGGAGRFRQESLVMGDDRALLCAERHRGEDKAAGLDVARMRLSSWTALLGRWRDSEHG